MTIGGTGRLGKRIGQIHCNISFVCQARIPGGDAVANSVAGLSGCFSLPFIHIFVHKRRTWLRIGLNELDSRRHQLAECWAWDKPPPYIMLTNLLRLVLVS